MVKWDLSMELRLRELANEGLMGQDVASKLSAEFGEFFSADAVFHKANRLGVSVRGRAGASTTSTSPGDPFGPPSWLHRELAKELEQQRQERPSKVVVMGWTYTPDEVTDAMVKQKANKAWRELWNEYVSEILRNDQCTPQQATTARKKIPAWFKRWAKVHVVIMWDIGNVDAKGMRKKMKQHDKVVKDVVAVESKDKTDVELKEDLENMENTNKAVTDAQKKEHDRQLKERIRKVSNSDKK